MKDDELKMNRIYWAEVIDKSCIELYGKQMKVKFTGIFFRNIDNLRQSFYLHQLKVFREVTNKEMQFEK